MDLNFKNIDFDNLFYKAETSFKNCINDKENLFLENEIEGSLNSIFIKKKHIKISFYHNNYVDYVFEVIHSLEIKNKEIGQYIYWENKNGEAVDDSLIFF